MWQHLQRDVVIGNVSSKTHLISMQNQGRGMRGLDHIHRMEPENLIKGKKKLGLTEYFT